MNKKVIFIIKLIIGLTLLFFLFYSVGFEKIINTISNMNLIYLSVLIPLYLLMIIISGINILILLKSINIKINTLKVLNYFSISWSLAQFILGKFGEFSIIYFLKKENISLGESTPITIIDKLITFLSLMIISFFGLFIFFNNKLAFLIILFLITLFIFILFLLFSKSFKNIFKKYILRKYSYNFKGFSTTLNFIIKKRKRYILLNFILTFVKWIVASFIVFFIFLSFNVKLNPIYILVIMSIMAIISLIPISINGLGINQVTALFFYGFLGIHYNIILSMSIIDLLFSYSIALIILSLNFDKFKKINENQHTNP